MGLSSMRRRALAAVAALVLASCGGSDEQEVQITELEDADQAVLSGEWSLDGATGALLIKTDEQWQQTWSERKARLECEGYVPFNEAACAADSPPAVDFSRYSVVGLLIGPVLEFRDPTPTRVFLERSGQVLVVEYQYLNTYHVPALIYTHTYFFLVPRTEAQLDVRAKEV